MKIATTFFMLIAAIYAQAQGIAGSIVDDKRETVINATVRVLQDGILKGSTISDIDGYYFIKPLAPGYYDLIAYYDRYDTVRQTKILVTQEKNTVIPLSLKAKNTTLQIEVKTYRVPVKRAEPHGVLTREEIMRMPTTQVGGECHYSGGPYQSKRGQAINMTGCRSTETVYFIDGVQIRDNDASTSDRKQKEVFTTPGHYTIKRNEAGKMPATNINDIASAQPGVYQQRRGDDLHIYGSR